MQQIDKIESVITESSHPLLYYNWLKLKPNKRYKLFLQLKTVNQRLENTCNQQIIKFTITSDNVIGEQGAKTLGKAFGMMMCLTDLNIIIQKGNQIGDNGLGDMLSGLNNISKLHLRICSDNKINSEGLILLAKQLKSMKQLRIFKLGIFQNKIDSQGILALYESLGSTNSLETLKLNLTDIKFNADDLIIIGKQIGQMNLLKNLNLLLIYEEDQESKALLNITEGLKNLSNLEKLQFKFKTNHFGNNGMSYLNQSILHLTHLKCIKLLFSRQSIEPLGCKNLCNGFETLQNLEHLKINIPFQIDEPNLIVSNLFNNLKNCFHIQKLFIALESVESVQLIGLLGYLKQLNPSNLILKREAALTFKRNHLTNQIETSNFRNFEQPLYSGGMRALLEGYKHLPSIRELTFYFSNENKIGQEGAILFSKQMSIFQNLSILKLNILQDSQIYSKGMSAIAGSLKLLVNLQEFQLYITSYNLIRFNSIVALCESLSTLSKLKELTLEIDVKNYSFQCDEETTQSKLCPLTYLESLQLFIHENEIDLSGSIVLSNWIQSLCNLSKLKVEISQTNRFESEQLIQIYKNIAFGIQQQPNLKLLWLKDINNYHIMSLDQRSLMNQQLFSNLIKLNISMVSKSEKHIAMLTQFLSKLHNLQSLVLEINSQVLLTMDDIIQFKQAFQYLNNLKELNFFCYNYHSHNDKHQIHQIYQELGKTFSLIKYLYTLKFSISFLNLGKTIALVSKRKCKRLIICKRSMISI